jgi:dihydroorotate dehydrogenase electron transfer subunit
MSVLATLVVRDIRPYGPAADDGEAGFFALSLECSSVSARSRQDWRNWQPGQFAMLRPSGWAPDMPWARPFSVCMTTDADVTFFFQIAGRGTRRMACLRAGDALGLWGPLGTGFVRPRGPTLLLAGGIGIVPFIGYARVHAGQDLRLMFAHRAPSVCYPLEHLPPSVRPEDYPERRPADRQRFLAAVAEAVRRNAASDGLVLACGPTPFLRHVRDVSLACGARTQISLEPRMACGIGACLGCVTMPSPAYAGAGEDPLPLRTCVEGPVFWADQIELESRQDGA